MVPEENPNDDASVQAEEQSKQAHIKERLKEMGVSQDSVRPEKSWLSKNVNFIIIAIVAVLVAAYVYEYKFASSQQDDNSVATQTTETSNKTAEISDGAVNSGWQYQQQPGQNWQGQNWQPQQASEQQWREEQKFNSQSQAQPSAPANKPEAGQQQYWGAGYGYQPPAMYWPQYGAYYDPRQGGYGGYYQPYPQYQFQQAPSQGQIENNSTGRSQQRAPGYPPAMPYTGPAYYNGWYRY